MEIAKKENYYHYNKDLKGIARILRMNMTKTEACLWKYVLGGRKLNGFQFRRQRPILNFIVDFMCKELKLIVEVDGITHTYESVHENDIKRQEELEKTGA